MMISGGGRRLAKACSTMKNRPLATLPHSMARSICSTPILQDNLKERLAADLENARQDGTFKQERVITSAQKDLINVQESETPVLNFCANNYLGLSNHPKLIEAAKKTLDTHGFGLSSVRFICGTQDLHKQLEKKIAEFHGMEDAILYPSCFDSNAGFFEAILGPDDAIISDELNHASIIDGVRLCKAQRHRYKHADVEDLERILQETQNCRTRVIATDGVFSMDGDVAPLKRITELAQKYDARVFIDECHATGFFGKTGRGTDEHCGVYGQVDFISSTLGKALGGATGGYTAASREVVDILRQRSRPYLFSNSLAPTVAGASLEVFNMLMNDNSLVSDLRDKAVHFRKKLRDHGFNVIGAEEHPIVPVMLGDAKLASDMSQALLEQGIYVIGFSYPVVPRGKARIRTQVSASHTFEQLDKAVEAFAAVGKKFGVLK